MKDFSAQMRLVKAELCVINELYAKLVAWVKARLATTLKTGHKEILPPDAEEHRILAAMDQQKAKTREFINEILRSVMEPERRQRLIDLREAVKKMAMDVRLEGKIKKPAVDESPFGTGLSELPREGNEE